MSAWGLPDQWGPASWVTLARATLAVGVAALVADSFTHDTPVALIVTLAAVALGLDAADGWVARRTGTATALGARFDGEVDAFLIAARTAGATAPPSQLLPLALLVLLGAALPNIGGWGPREGVTAWAFGAAGLGASLGVASAVVYGVMVFVASLPGAAVLAVGVLARREGARGA